MFKRFLTLALTLTMATIAMAFNFTGKTYQWTHSEGGKTATITVKFTSPTSVTMSSKATGTKPSSIRFRYEVSGEVLNLYSNNGIDYLYIDTNHEYGEDCIYMLDPYGNVYMVFDRVESSTSAKSSKSGKRRR